MKSFEDPNSKDNDDVKEKSIPPKEKSQSSKQNHLKNIPDTKLPLEVSAAENEDEEKAEIIKIITANIDNEDFRKKISPTESEKLSIQSFQKALDQLLSSDINLPKIERLKLFHQTLEYYANNQKVAELPIWHSTSSYALRKSLEEGFEGGHGNYSGEHSHIKGTEEINYDAQKPLSVSYTDHPTSELSQQLYAKLSCKKEDLSKFISLDYEKITEDLLVVQLIESLREHDLEELKIMIALSKKLKPEEISDDEALQFKISEQDIEKWKKRTHEPNFIKIKNEVLPNIDDLDLREQLSQEAQHSFPCFVTFEAENLKQNLTRFSRGKHEAHLPYEDHYWGNLPANQIREIRVPQNQIEKTKKWLEEKGLTDVPVIPIEVYEVKRLIEHNI